MILRILITSVLFGSAVALVFGQSAGEVAIIAAIFAISGLIGLLDLLRFLGRN